MTNVEVKLLTRQQIDGEISEMCVESSGTLEGRQNGWILRYTEPKTEEAYGADVCMMISNKKALIKRTGPINSTMPLADGKRQDWHYETPYGTMEFPVLCTGIEQTFTAKGGRFFAAYLVETPGDTAAGMISTMELLVKEVQK